MNGSLTTSSGRARGQAILQVDVERNASESDNADTSQPGAKRAAWESPALPCRVGGAIRTGVPQGRHSVALYTVSNKAPTWAGSKMERKRHRRQS